MKHHVVLRREAILDLHASHMEGLDFEGLLAKKRKLSKRVCHRPSRFSKVSRVRFLLFLGFPFGEWLCFRLMFVDCPVEQHRT